MLLIGLFTISIQIVVDSGKFASDTAMANFFKHLSVATLAVLAVLPARGAEPGKPIPQLDHVFVIVMENHSYDEIMGNANAPFINQLSETANLAKQYYAIGHPSLTNYLELIGGSNFGVTSDVYPNWHDKSRDPSLVRPIVGAGVDVATPADTGPLGKPVPVARYVGISIADQLAMVGKRWKSYQESLPSSGADNVNYSDGSFSNLDSVEQSKILKLYAVKHNPFVYFDSVQCESGSSVALHNVVGFGGADGLYSDLASGGSPDLSFIAPNQCHDMHGTGESGSLCGSDKTAVLAGDRVVSKIVSAIKHSSTWSKGRNAIVLLWDENDFSATPNRVVAIVDTSYGLHGIKSTTPYNHFSLLKTLQAGFGLPCLNHSCDASVKVMGDLF